MFPVDIVYTWVDTSDKTWLAKRKAMIRTLSPQDRAALCRDGLGPVAPTGLDELKYSLRSVDRYVGFVRKIFIITDGQVPEWLNIGHPQIEIISHETLFHGEGAQPCFNSHAIESRLHHIPGLSEHFLYFNDDFFLGAKVSARTFFKDPTTSLFFPSPVEIIRTRPGRAELAISAAAGNGQRLLAQRFNRVARHRIRHAPYALQRSVLQEMEQEFPQEFARTAGHPFRHQQDHSIAAFLYFYYAQFTGRAEPGKIRHMFLDQTMQRFWRKAAAALFTRRYHCFCINGASPAGRRVLRAFLDACFPDKSRFEKKSV